MRMQIIEPDGFNIFILVFYLYLLYVFANELSTDAFNVFILPKAGKEFLACRVEELTLLN